MIEQFSGALFALENPMCGHDPFCAQALQRIKEVQVFQPRGLQDVTDEPFPHEVASRLYQLVPRRQYGIVPPQHRRHKEGTLRFRES